MTSGVARIKYDPSPNSISRRYADFANKARAAGFLAKESLLETIDLPMRSIYSHEYAYAKGDIASASNLLDNFPPKEWGYFLPLTRSLSTLGVVSELNASQDLSRKRSNYRLNLIFEGLEAAGINIRDKRVLDIACNWGGFSIEAALRGAASVDAFDIRASNVAKASALRDHFSLKNISFSESDLMKYASPDAPYDIVLNLGLMYHLGDPVGMMKQTYQLTGHVAVLDSLVHREPFSGFILGTGHLATEHASNLDGVELHPTYRGLIDLAYLVGFRRVVELRCEPGPAWENFSNDPYGNGSRRCVIAIK